MAGTALRKHKAYWNKKHKASKADKSETVAMLQNAHALTISCLQIYPRTTLFFDQIPCSSQWWIGRRSRVSNFELAGPSPLHPKPSQAIWPNWKAFSR